MLFIVSMEWNDEQQKWLICNARGEFIYDYQDCANVNAYFLNKLDKNKKKYFRLIIEEVTSGKAEIESTCYR